MAEALNSAALRKAQSLIASGDVVREDDSWSESAPTTEQQNDFIAEHGWEEYALWHLGVDETKSEQTKARFSFPYGDFSRVHRSAIIAIESRAGQYDHTDIEDAAKKLLAQVDKD